MILLCAAVAILIKYHPFMLSKYIDFNAPQTLLACSWVVNLAICTLGWIEPHGISDASSRAFSDTILGRAWHLTYLNTSGFKMTKQASVPVQPGAW